MYFCITICSSHDRTIRNNLLFVFFPFCFVRRVIWYVPVFYDRAAVNTPVLCAYIFRAAYFTTFFSTWLFFCVRHERRRAFYGRYKYVMSGRVLRTVYII